jgi:uncharacterized small protein (TIGR04563 family)
MAAHTDKQKQSLYFPEDVLREIMKEANRLDRSLSWTVQHAWRVAREEIRKFPAAGARAEPARERPPERERQPARDERSSDPDRYTLSPQVREFLKGKFDREIAG